uniref:Uncharacterized protein n=1 Tax=Anguilla anguilla TaxID=7936 RepID=A0A0E9S696_ANGAN
MHSLSHDFTPGLKTEGAQGQISFCALTFKCTTAI